MITFSLYNLSAMGSAIVSENGDTLQKCIVETKIDGLISDNKVLTDVIDFIVPNTVMVGSPTPTVAGWEYIKNVLAPEWVIDNYKEI